MSLLEPNNNALTIGFIKNVFLNYNVKEFYVYEYFKNIWYLFFIGLPILFFFEQIMQINSKEKKSKLLYFTNLFLYVTLQLPVLVISLPLYPFYGKDVLDKIYNISIFILDKLFVKINFLNDYPYNNNHILLVNHTSSVDGYLRHILKNYSVSVIKESLFFIPFLGQLYWLMGMIFIKRNNKNSRINTRKKMLSALNKNNIVHLFPQGTREKNKRFYKNEILLRKGSIEIAVENNIPIVLCYNNIGDRVDDINKVIHLNKKVYAIISNIILLPEEHNDKPFEEKVDILYKIIYDEFCRLEKIVLDKVNLR
jgi:1-acyl-sn-glycerol-3-phosphate acyltransferase